MEKLSQSLCRGTYYRSVLGEPAASTDGSLAAKVIRLEVISKSFPASRGGETGDAKPIAFKTLIGLLRLTIYCSFYALFSYNLLLRLKYHTEFDMWALATSASLYSVPSDFVGQLNAKAMVQSSTLWCLRFATRGPTRQRSGSCMRSVCVGHFQMMIGNILLVCACSIGIPELSRSMSCISQLDDLDTFSKPAWVLCREDHGRTNGSAQT